MTIYYEDTDAGGVVYHANYVKYFDRARTEFLRHLGVNQSIVQASGHAFMVRAINIDYLKPAFLDDKLTVTARISQQKSTSLIFTQAIYNDRKQLLTKALVTIVYVNLKRKKPCRLPEYLSSLSFSPQIQSSNHQKGANTRVS